MKLMSALALLLQYFGIFDSPKYFSIFNLSFSKPERHWSGFYLLLPVFIAVCCCGQLRSEVPGVTSLFPAGLQRGTTAELKLNGKPGTLPLQVVSDSDELTDFQLSEKGDSLTLTATATAKTGLHWLRFYNQEGASSLLPVYVGTLPERTEKEPNNSTAQAESIDSLPTTINGVLHQSSEVETYALALQKGIKLTASVTAHESLGSPMDSVLQVLDSNGFIITQNDDDHGFDSLLEFEAPEDGTYFVRLFCFPATPNSTIRFAGGKDYIYRLSLTDSEFSLAPTLKEANEAKQSVPALHAFNEKYRLFKEETHSSELETILLVDGKIEEPNQSGVHRLTVKKGDALRVQVLAREIASLLDPVLIIRKPDGGVYKEIDDSDREKRDIDYDWKVTSDGEYRIEVFDRYQHAGDRYYYLLAVSKNVPRVELTVAADHFELKRDAPLEIPVSISRLAGFKSKMTIQIKNPPAGLKVSEVVSEEKGDSSKKVTLKLDGADAAAYQGPIHITGIIQDEKSEVTATASLKTMGQTTRQLWLTIPEKPAAKSK